MFFVSCYKLSNIELVEIDKFSQMVLWRPSLAHMYFTMVDKSFFSGFALLNMHRTMIRKKHKHTHISGQVLKTNCRQIPDYAIVPTDGFPIDRTVNNIATNGWLVRIHTQNST